MVTKLEQRVAEIGKTGTATMEERVSLALLSGCDSGRGWAFREVLDDIRELQEVVWQSLAHSRYVVDVDKLTAKIQARLDKAKEQTDE